MPRKKGPASASRKKRIAPVQIRFSPETLDYLKLRAEGNNRTLSAEILSRLNAGILDPACDTGLGAMVDFVIDRVSVFANASGLEVGTGQERQVQVKLFKAVIDHVLDRLSPDAKLAPLGQTMARHWGEHLTHTLWGQESKPDIFKLSEEQGEKLKRARAWVIESGLGPTAGKGS